MTASSKCGDTTTSGASSASPTGETQSFIASCCVALAVEPPEQHRDGAGIVAQLVRRAGDDAQLGLAVGVADDARVEVRDRLVVGAVHDQQRAAAQITHALG